MHFDHTRPNSPQQARPSTGDFVRITYVSPLDKCPAFKVGDLILLSGVTPVDEELHYSWAGTLFMLESKQSGERQTVFGRCEVLSSWMADFWLDAIDQSGVASVQLRDHVHVLSPLYMKELVRVYRMHRDLVCAAHDNPYLTALAQLKPKTALECEAQYVAACERADDAERDRLTHEGGSESEMGKDLRTFDYVSAYPQTPTRAHVLDAEDLDERND